MKRTVIATVVVVDTVLLKDGNTMKNTFVRTLALATSLLFVASSAEVALAQSTAFTYQGRLEEVGVPAGGLHDFRFRLFNASSGGVQVGQTLCLNDVDVVRGLFTVPLDFGQQYATPSERHLDVEVRADTGLDCSNVTGFLALSPRQQLTATPLASHAKSAFALDASDGSPVNAVFVDNAGKVGVGTTTPTAKLDVKGEGDTSFTGTPIARFMRGNADNFLAIFGDIGGNYIVADDPTNNQKDLRLQTRNNRNILLEPHGTGGVGIGTAPATLLHARGAGPAMVLQDTASASNQAGYVAFWNNAGTETAWAGFGTAGSTDFSVVNARSGGDIVLWPFSGDVVVNGRIDIGLEVVQSPGFFVSGSETTLACPAGKRALGGGCWCGDEAVKDSSPRGTGWFCRCDGSTFGEDRVIAYAVCGRVK